MTFNHRYLNCCGIQEIIGLNTGGHFSAAAVLEYICRGFGYSRYQNAGRLKKKSIGSAYFVMSYAYWSNNKTNKPGSTLGTKKDCTRITKLLKSYISRNELGELVVLPDKGNPNYSGNHVIRMFVFVPSAEGLCNLSARKKWPSAEEWLVK